jgi:hypothetical protein
MNKTQITPEQYDVLRNGAEPVIKFDVGESAWEVKQLGLTWEKVDLIWDLLQSYRSIFSDLTRGDKQNFVRLLGTPDTFWLEAFENGKLNALIYFTGLENSVEATGHLIVLDREAASKVELIKRVARYVFDHFPINRITAPTPAIYFATIRMLKKAGFTHEGSKRQAVLISGRWHDLDIYGLLRGEV